MRIRRSLTVKELYLQHKKMIYERAWYAESRYGGIVPFDELVSEGHVIFMQAVRKFDPDRGVKFSTVLYTYLSNGLLSFCKLWDEYKRMELQNENLVEIPGDFCRPEARILLLQNLKQLSVEAQGVVCILLECPTELMELAKGSSAKQIKKALFRFLCEKLGWCPFQVQRVFGEIRSSLASW